MLIGMEKFGYNEDSTVVLMKSLIPQLCWGEWSKQERVRYQ